MRNVYGTDNLIVWQKWFDPFGEDDTVEHDKLADDHYDKEEDLDGEYVDEMQNVKQPLRAIATPMGLIPYTENTASGKIFNFWVGHTNFNINNQIVNIIDQIDGVETLDIFTRYRFRISIGKVFDDARVMKEINDQIYEYLGN
jgi:hypothetical protein